METPDGQDLQLLINALKDVRDVLPQVLGDVATSMSLTAKALAERKIKDIGFNQVYSTATVPAYFMTGFKGKNGKTYTAKHINNRGRDYVKAVESDQAKMNRQMKTNYRARISWKEFREAQGLPSSHVDLTYSGKMWAGMFPQEVERIDWEFTAPLGGSNKEAQDKMNWNYERYGDFIGEVLTGDVLDKIYEIGISEMIRLIDDKLGWAIDK